MHLHSSDDPRAASTRSPEELRREFLLPGLFRPGEASFRWWETDRTVLGGLVPLGAPLVLGNPAGLKSSYFLERREAGVINLGGPGRVRVDGVEHVLAPLDGLYLGRGARAVDFASDDPAHPARYWFVCYPAHAAYPTRHIAHRGLPSEKLGARETANERTLFKYIHEGAFPTCQVVMGFTRLEPGNVWNTMPPHTHLRRSEVYLYFDVQPGQAVFHFMGEPQATRHLVVRDLEAVLSPPWSIHCGVGTAAYAFVWAMGGENQVFADMDPAPISELK